MTVRFCKEEDRQGVVAMLPRANLAAGFGPDGLVPLMLSEERCNELFSLHLNHELACAIVHAPGDNPMGFLFAALFAHPFDPNVRIAKDSGWWIESAVRGDVVIANKMMELYEEWAKAKGCQWVGMAGMGEDPKIGRFLKRRDYTVAETHFLKKL